MVMARPVNRILAPVTGACRGLRRMAVPLAAATGLVLALPVVLVGSATQAAGHSQEILSVPAAGSVVPVSPTAISLVFSEPIEPRHSSLGLLDGAGRTLLGGVGVPDRTDPDVLAVSLGGLFGVGFTLAGRALPRTIRATSRVAVLGGSLVGGVLGIALLIGGTPR
jgi:hypothetical protein